MDRGQEEESRPKKPRRRRARKTSSRKGTAHAGRPQVGPESDSKGGAEDRPEGGAEEEGLRVREEARSPRRRRRAPPARRRAADGSRSRRRSAWPPRLRPRARTTGASSWREEELSAAEIDADAPELDELESELDEAEPAARARTKRNGDTRAQTGVGSNSSQLPLPGSCSAREKKVPRNRDLRTFRTRIFPAAAPATTSRGSGVGRRFLSRFTYVTSASVTRTRLPTPSLGLREDLDRDRDRRAADPHETRVERHEVADVDRLVEDRPRASPPSR